VVIQSLSGLGESDPAGCAPEQLLAELFLQPRDPPTDRRSRQSQLSTRRRKASISHNSREDRDIIQIQPIHINLISLSNNKAAYRHFSINHTLPSPWEADMTTTAQKTRSTFRMSISVGIDIDAPREQVWALLTDAAGLPGWNSAVLGVKGQIAAGETIELTASVAPERVFKLKVSDVVAGEGMVWSDGFAPIFRGVRTYRLSASAGGGTRFEMVEVFSGLMLPLIAGSLPDLGPSFEAWASDLKATAEG
jgi:uncharacterized protein YndB with AHSA1/START domain